MIINNKKIALSILIVSVLVVFGAFSYAYFTAIGETKPQDASLSTATMRLRFSDNDNGVNAELKFGDFIYKEFVLENTGNVDASAKIDWVDLINTYTYGSLTYEVEFKKSENEEFIKLIEKRNVPLSLKASRKVLIDSLSIPAGEKYFYRLIVHLENLETVDQSPDLNAHFSTRFELRENKYASIDVLEYLGLTLNGEDIHFDQPALDNGIYAMDDDDGTSYFYRGNITDNYVKFGKWSDDVASLYVGFHISYPSIRKIFDSLNACQNDPLYSDNCTLVDNAGKDMYWRIVRINGDGSVRLFYDGTTPHANDDVSIERAALYHNAYNVSSDDAKYVGWMYGGEDGVASTSKDEAQRNDTDSTVKIDLDEWYRRNFSGSIYEDHLADSVFCNDRITNSNPNEWGENDTTLGYGINMTIFAGQKRMYDQKTTFKCAQKNDAFTANDTNKGNGALTYPIGLLTYDEVLAAGSNYYQNGIANTFIRKGYTDFTMTPSVLDSRPKAAVIAILGDGTLSYGAVENEYIVSPVINLKSNTAAMMFGTGTMSDPFRIE